MELGYNPYGSGGYGFGSAGYHDEDNDGFNDVATGLRGGYGKRGYGSGAFSDEFDDVDFDGVGESNIDPFPEDLPVWE